MIATQLSLWYEMSLRVTIFHLLYISNGSRKKPDCSALDGVHVSEQRCLATTYKQQEEKKVHEANTPFYTFHALKSALF